MSYDLILPLVHGYSITMVTLLRSKKIQCAVMQWKSQRSILPCAFFFLQAEDGIRDCHVTGVQTCALPISTPNQLARLPRLIRLGSGSLRLGSGSLRLRPGPRPLRSGPLPLRPDPAPRRCAPRRPGRRSEERRVGIGSGFGTATMAGKK